MIFGLNYACALMPEGQVSIPFRGKGGLHRISRFRGKTKKIPVSIPFRGKGGLHHGALEYDGDVEIEFQSPFEEKVVSILE